VGEPAPGFTVNTLDGSALSLSELRGQVTVVNFWSPECAPCEEEIPDLQAVWEEYRSQGVVFLGISFPELEAGVEDMIADLGVTYPNALDLVAPAQYRITGIPETFVIDPQGRVAYVHIGPVTAQRLRAELDTLLAK
jgi:cytochrome c biogenesis protein CcmG/thiol:disulfide interchange protein DsbE